MADNTTLPLGTADGDTYASDDISGIKFQRVKLVLGADGTNGGDVASDNPVPVSSTRSTTGTTTGVFDTATSTTLLASNANRLGATILNDSSAALLVKLGATASTSSYTVRLIQNAYYELPYGYTGIIDGIWESDPGTGSARITEFT